MDKINEIIINALDKVLPEFGIDMGDAERDAYVYLWGNSIVKIVRVEIDAR